MNILTIGNGKNHNFGKLVDGILELAPAALIVSEQQYIGNNATRYANAGYLPIIYTDKPEDTDEGHYEAIYTETDGKIVQSWEFVSDIPNFSSEDNGKFLMVVDGKVAAVSIPNITEEVF